MDSKVSDTMLYVVPQIDSGLIYYALTWTEQRDKLWTQLFQNNYNSLGLGEHTGVN